MHFVMGDIHNEVKKPPYKNVGIAMKGDVYKRQAVDCLVPGIDEIMEFANKEMGNVVLSIDGRKEVHDHMRPCLLYTSRLTSYLPSKYQPLPSVFSSFC